jgi:hypothetical protein
MQGKMHPFRLDIEFPLQFFNTPGTEITPRSNVICEDLQDDWFSHVIVLPLARLATLSRIARCL